MSTRKRLLLLLGICCLLVTATLATSDYSHAPRVFAAFSQSCPEQQAEGNTGAVVQVIQFRLNSLNQDGYLSHTYGNPFPLATDGDFGSLTKTAVRDFQGSLGMGADGVVGNLTWSAMGFCTAGVIGALCCSSTSMSHFPGTLEEGSTGTFVSELQRGLNVDAEGGFIGESYGGVMWFPLSVDGNFGTRTKDAVQSLQQAAGITRDGIVGQRTWGAFAMSY